MPLDRRFAPLFQATNRGLNATEVAIDAGIVNAETPPPQRFQLTANVEVALLKAVSDGELVSTQQEQADGTHQAVYWLPEKAPAPVPDAGTDE